jgi:hypothetical protein
MIKCVMLQFAGTTTTGIILGEPAHWITDNSSFTGARAWLASPVSKLLVNYAVQGRS